MPDPEIILPTGYDIPTEPETPPPAPRQVPENVICAFVVFLGPDGRWGAHTNLALFDDVTIAREGDLTDFASGCAAIANDVSLLRTRGLLAEFGPAVASGVINGQIELARRAQEQEHTQSILRATQANPAGNRASRRS